MTKSAFFFVRIFFKVFKAVGNFFLLKIVEDNVYVYVGSSSGQG